MLPMHEGVVSDARMSEIAAPSGSHLTRAG